MAPKAAQQGAYEAPQGILQLPVFSVHGPSLISSAAGHTCQDDNALQMAAVFLDATLYPISRGQCSRSCHLVLRPVNLKHVGNQGSTRRKSMFTSMGRGNTQLLFASVPDAFETPNLENRKPKPLKRPTSSTPATPTCLLGLEKSTTTVSRPRNTRRVLRCLAWQSLMLP